MWNGKGRWSHDFFWLVKKSKVCFFWVIMWYSNSLLAIFCLYFCFERLTNTLNQGKFTSVIFSVLAINTSPPGLCQVLQIHLHVTDIWTQNLRKDLLNVNITTKCIKLIVHYFIWVYKNIKRFLFYKTCEM